jgi:hypothetical protein
MASSFTPLAESDVQKAMAEIEKQKFIVDSLQGLADREALNSVQSGRLYNAAFALIL